MNNEGTLQKYLGKKKNIEVQIAIVQGRFNHRTVADR